MGHMHGTQISVACLVQLTGGGEGCWLGTMENGGIMEAQKLKKELKKIRWIHIHMVLLLPKDLCNNNGTTNYIQQTRFMSHEWEKQDPMALLHLNCNVNIM